MNAVVTSGLEKETLTGVQIRANLIFQNDPNDVQKRQIS
jgi:hypothetical protein